MKRNEGSSSIGGKSVVFSFGKRLSSCGYCNSQTPTGFSHGVRAHSVTINDYQDLLDRGWRRSGCYLYKPEMDTTCCPAYTIRLKAADFFPSKEQLRVSRRMQRFLDGALEFKQSVEFVESSDACNDDTCDESNGEKDREEEIMNDLSDLVDNAVRSCLDSVEFPVKLPPKASVKMVLQAKRKLLAAGSEDLLYSCNVAFQLAAAIRRCVLDQKEAHTGRESGHRWSPKLIAENLESSLNKSGSTSDLSARACNGHLNFYSVTKPISSDVNVQVVRNSKGAARSERKGSRLDNDSEYTDVKRRKLVIRLKRSGFDREEYALYKKYQTVVHNDSPGHVTEASYRRFLVDTPLTYVPPTNDGTVPPSGFGSFHQQYVIDGKLVAVGVIDILPKCLSSKYLFWDPDFAFLSLGKYSALQEINWVKENQLHCSTLQYYYLGYYIHSCSKMRYKAAYRPSELLCPLRYQWIPFDVSKPALDRNKYVVLSEMDYSSVNVSEDVLEIQQDDNDQDSDFVCDEGINEPEYERSANESLVADENGDADNVLIALKGSHVRFKDIKQAFGPADRRYLEAQLSKYSKVLGEELAGRMVYTVT